MSIQTKHTDKLKDQNISDKAISSLITEFNYQEKLWNENTTETAGFSSNASFLVFIDSYLSEAINIISRGAEPEVSLKAAHNVRKIATMVFNCSLKNNWLEQLLDSDFTTISNLTLVDSLACLSHYKNEGFKNVALSYPESVKTNLCLIFWTCMKVMSSSEDFAPKRV